jgi:lipopolysaccharide transport system ATP-binding protein
LTDTAIKVEGLSKRYRIGAQQLANLNLREKLNEMALAPFRAVKHLAGRNGHKPKSETFWALKDVSFEVKRGEIVGIIGRNGAGKSTLLKILSRITEPTKGYADISGRIGSLLEVGTGFHPELTGRENIYLNGSILGMKRAEINKKFDEIVAFAEIEKFIDTPVKHYSSGMYVRLAFGVAAHLEPEILLVDEVLAVGDAAFQKKSLGKMGDVAKQGRTVLFVSHNMAAIQRLCPNSLLLETGQLVNHGSTDQVVNEYLSESGQTAKANHWVDVSRASRGGSGEVRFKAFKYDLPTSDLMGLYSYDSIEVSMELISDAPRSVGSVAVTLYDQHGTKLINADTLSLGQSFNFKEGLNIVSIRIDKVFLNSGVYTLGLWTADPIAGTFDHIEAAGRIEVFRPIDIGFGQTPNSDGLVPCSFDAISR